MKRTMTQATIDDYDHQARARLQLNNSTENADVYLWEARLAKRDFLQIRHLGS